MDEPRKRKNPAAVALGSRGGKASKRALELRPEYRKLIRQRAARARWDRRPPPTDELG